jgi:hypothetical protein
VCYIGYVATIILVTRYENEKLLFRLFIVLGIINAAAIVGQFMRIPVANQIVDILNLADSAYLQDIEGRSEAASYFYMPGIFGVVYSGYMTMVVSILSAKYQIGRISLFGLFLSSFFLIACFMVQERSSIALGIVVTLYIMVMALVGKVRKVDRVASLIVFILLFSGLVYGLVWGYELILSGESRIAESGLDLGRESIYNSARSYILEYPLAPGIERFTATYHTYPHNLFYNAYIYGGPFGFIAIVVLVIMMFALVFPYFYKSFSKEKGLLIVLCFSFLAYNVNSFVHNNSFVTGDMFLWVIWGAILSLIKREQELGGINHKIKNHE